jgi:hypothetical protein
MENALQENINSPIASAEAIELLRQNKEEIGQLKADNLYLRQELDKLKRMIFGSKASVLWALTTPLNYCWVLT